MNSLVFNSYQKSPLLRKIRFFDVESSGLHEGSFPMQFGWCGLDLISHQFLVCPHESWTIDLVDPNATKIHGISREETIRHGHSIWKSAHMLNKAFSSSRVICDAPKYDGYWTDHLFQTAGIDSRFSIDIIDTVIEEDPSIINNWCLTNYHDLVEVVDFWYPHTHKADEDSLRDAALFKALIDPDWALSLLEREITPKA